MEHHWQYWKFDNTTMTWVVLECAWESHSALLVEAIFFPVISVVRCAFWWVMTISVFVTRLSKMVQMYFCVSLKWTNRCYCLPCSFILMNAFFHLVLQLLVSKQKLKQCFMSKEIIGINNNLNVVLFGAQN